MPRKARATRIKRICRFVGCRQVLSVYNPSHHCYIHQRHTADQMIIKHKLDRLEPVLAAA